MLLHPPRASEASGTRFPCSYGTSTLLPTCKDSARDRALRCKMKVQERICKGSERSGRFLFITRPKGQAYLRKQARKLVASSPDVQLLLPSSEKEEGISLLPILKISAAQSGLGMDVFSPVPRKGTDPGSAGQSDPEAVTSPQGSAFLVPPA